CLCSRLTFVLFSSIVLCACWLLPFVLAVPFLFEPPATPATYTLSLHDALPIMYDDRQPQHGDGEDHPHGREQPSTAHCHTGHRCEGGGLDETHPVSPPEQSNDPAEIHQQDQCAREAAPHPQVGDARKGDRHGW